MNLPCIEIVPKISAEGDHATNGLADVTVEELTGTMRVVRSQLEEQRIGRRLEATDPLLAWIPRHAANCVSLYKAHS